MSRHSLPGDGVALGLFSQVVSALKEADEEVFGSDVDVEDA